MEEPLNGDIRVGFRLASRKAHGYPGCLNPFSSPNISRSRYCAVCHCRIAQVRGFRVWALGGGLQRFRTGELRVVVFWNPGLNPNPKP